MIDELIEIIVQHGTPTTHLQHQPTIIAKGYKSYLQDSFFH